MCTTYSNKLLTLSTYETFILTIWSKWKNVTSSSLPLFLKFFSLSPDAATGILMLWIDEKIYAERIEDSSKFRPRELQAGETKLKCEIFCLSWVARALKIDRWSKHSTQQSAISRSFSNVSTKTNLSAGQSKPAVHVQFTSAECTTHARGVNSKPLSKLIWASGTMICPL